MGEILIYEQPQRYIVNSIEYDDSFKIPVLTAGKSFILGFTDETENIKEASPYAPVIIFDDFTTSSHYVDFPFKVKSSAMKILSPLKNNIDMTFIHATLGEINYVPENHERQWISKYSSFLIRIPTENEQLIMGDFFRKLSVFITLHQRKQSSA